MKTRRYVVRHRGVEVELFTLGLLAKVVGRTVQAVGKQISAGYIPETPFRRVRRDNAPCRLYTRAQIEAVQAVVAEVGAKAIRAEKREEMYSKILARWEAAGIVLDDLVNVGGEEDEKTCSPGATI